MTLAELTRFAGRYAEALIAESKGHFDSAEYERQLKPGVD
jgi:hypothetical protein